MRFIILLVCFICHYNTAFANRQSISCELMDSGVANQVFLITTSDEKLVLKLYKRKTVEQMQQSCELLKVIESHGIPTCPVLLPPTQIGQQTVSVSQFIEGTHINSQHLKETAQMMAQLHSIRSPILLSEATATISSNFDQCTDWQYYQELKELYESLDLSYLDDLPQGIIHGDFSYTNLLCDKNGVLTLIDFDHLRYDYLLTDLVRSQLFYSFEEDGSFKENTLFSFVSEYNFIRPLRAVECDNFFTHLKLSLLNVAIEMYYHMYVAKDLNTERILKNPSNQCLDPDLLAREILSLKQRTSYNFQRQEQPNPIFFFGLSGVGKTTLIQLLASSSDLFYIPKFTVTRAPRQDDDPRYFEYFSIEEFKQCQEAGEFFVSMNQEGVYYGYRLANLIDADRHPLMNASAYGVDEISTVKGVRVLIKGDPEKGLSLRGDTKIAETRRKVNKLAVEKFFGNQAFLDKMHIVHINELGDPEKSAKLLKKKIIWSLDHDN